MNLLARTYLGSFEYCLHTLFICAYISFLWKFGSYLY